MPDLRLHGCHSRPLISYLKTLGLLRVVAEQADPGAALRWHEGAAELRSELDREALAAFLLDRYRPSPVLSPWNGGSGFFPKDDRAALGAIESAHSHRFDAWRVAVRVAREALAELGLRDKPSDGDTKLELMRCLRARWSDAAVRWLDAAVVLLADGREFPPLLGSGGNDGRYDISNNFAQAVVLALPLDGAGKSHARGWLESAVHGGSVTLVGMSVAHLDRQKSPVNSPDGEADGMANPWDLVLAVEGSLMLAAGAARRGIGATGVASAPFTVTRTAAGYGSAVAGEKGRAELWLPLWPYWTTAPELETVLREGRAQVGRASAASGLEFARAAAELGVARGISAFERYAVLERAGQANLALATGQIDVVSRPEVRLLHQVERWTRRVTGLAAGDAPGTIRAAGRALERALFVFARGPSPANAQRLVETVGEAESALARSAATAGGGPRPLDGGAAQGWLDAADDGSLDFTLVAALASLRDRQGTPGLPALRDYLHGTSLTSEGRVYDPRRAATVPRSARPLRRLGALLVRRHLDAAVVGAELGFPLGVACPRAAAALLATEAPEIDFGRVLRLASGLCLFDFSGASWRPTWSPSEPPEPSPAHALLVLAFQGTREHPLTPRQGWADLLAAGHVRRALDQATIRLRVAEMVPVPTAGDLAPGAPAGPALAAALLLHLSAGDRAVLARRLLNIPAPDPHRSHPMNATATDVLAPLKGESRLVLDADLAPIVGSAIQPTGFANLGAATFERAGESPSLLVESVQSLVNHLESLGWDDAAHAPVQLLARLPYLAVRHAQDDAYLTSSRTEPHRLAAAYVRDATTDGQQGTGWLSGRLGLAAGRPLDWRVIYAAVFQLDPLCLLHGVFFSDKAFHGNPKVRRAITLVVEAHDVREAVSGGLKRDDVAFNIEKGTGQGAEEGYGFVPFGRTEYTAGRIVLSAAVDLAQVRGYGLPQASTELLSLLALWELRRLLDAPLRLRTRCDLEVTGIAVRRPEGVELPSRDALEAAIAAVNVEFEQPGARILRWSPKGKKA